MLVRRAGFGAWFPVLSGTLGKFLNVSFSFLICRVGMIIVPSPQSSYLVVVQELERVEWGGHNILGREETRSCEGSLSMVPGI